MISSVAGAAGRPSRRSCRDRPRSRPDAHCTSRGVPSASTSPWFIASTRSDTFDTSVMSCSTISTVMPSSCWMSWIQNAMSSVSSTLRPDDGSSSSSSFGSVHSARASSTTLRTPYGRPATIESRWCCRSSRSITRSTFSRAAISARRAFGVKSSSLPQAGAAVRVAADQQVLQHGRVLEQLDVLERARDAERGDLVRRHVASACRPSNSISPVVGV